MGSRNSKIANAGNPLTAGIQKSAQRDKQRERAEKEKRKREALEKKQRDKKEKEERRRKKKKLSNVKNVPGPIVVSVKPNTISSYEQRVIRKIQEQLARDSPTFVLNQIMLSFQFFKNYERDIDEAAVLHRKLENAKTQQIFRHCKHVILPDRLHETVDKYIKYLPRHGANKRQLQSLHTQTMYIICENIEVIKQDQDPNALYSSIGDKPVHKMIIETQSKRKFGHTGYFRLKGVDGFGKPMPTFQNKNMKRPKDSIKGRNGFSNGHYSDNSDEDDDDDDDDDDEDDIDIPVPITVSRPGFRDSLAVIAYKNKMVPNRGAGKTKKSPRHTASTSSSPHSSEYDYAYITALNTHQPLGAMQTLNDEYLSTTQMPTSVITNVTIPIGEPKMTDSEDSSDSESERPRYETKQCFNSKKFFIYFTNIFRQTLAADLGFSPEDLSKATWKGACIYLPQWEIFPALQCEWPEREGFEWIERPRKVMQNEENYQWPTIQMIQKVRSFGCHLIPIGYTPKNATNPDREFEWKIVFPMAEQYLESCLTNAQAKIYMVTKVLIKTFVEPNIDPKYNMFTTEHLRAHLFWQCENNYVAWPEDYLGEALVRFLSSLLDRISKHTMPDYFLRQRNLFENIPEIILFDLHKQITRIIENPVMYVMIALRNCYPVGEMESCPQLNFKSLYADLTCQNALSRVNPTHFQKPKSDESSDDDMTVVGPMAYLEKGKSKKKNKKNKVRFKKDENKKALEYINVAIHIRKHTDEMRRLLYFRFFIPHFILMAKHSTNTRSLHLAMVYVKHAEILCQILLDDTNNRDVAVDFLDEIKTTTEKIENLKNRGSYAVPDLPRRESMLDPQLRQQWRRNTTTLPKKIDEDPYTNIVDLNKEVNNNNTKNTKNSSQGIQPVDDYSSSSDDESNVYGRQLRRPTIRQNGGIPNGIVQHVEVAQVHSAPRSNNDRSFSVASDGENDEDLAAILGNVVVKEPPPRPKVQQINNTDIMSMDELLGNIRQLPSMSPPPIKKKSVAFSNGFGGAESSEEDTSF